MESQSLDIAELRNLVKWLDEQQRKSRQEVAVLQQTIEFQKREIDDLTGRIKLIEDKHPEVLAVLNRMSRTEQLVDGLRGEIHASIGEVEERRTKSEKEMERLRLVEYQSLSRAVADMKQEVTPIPRIVESVDQRKAEEERLSAAIGSLQNQIPPIEARLEERIRDVSYVEEGLRQNVKRTAEVQQTILDIQKRIDQMLATILPIQDWQQRTQVKLDKLTQTEQERRNEVLAFMEQTRLAAQERVQEINVWAKKLEANEETMEDYSKRWRHFDEQFRKSKQAIDDLEGFKQVIESLQAEAADSSRLEIERIKQKWTEYQIEDDRRQKQLTLELDQGRTEQVRERDDHRDDIGDLKEKMQTLATDVKTLYDLQEKYADSFRQITRIWLEGYESVVTTPPTRKIPG
ncbi:MAG: hypothetical protein ABFQ89_06605 [Chloroflexota bacterium]